MDVDVEAQRRREECERKARRGEMDPRLEFVFQLLMDGTQIPRHQIMDHIFEGDMVTKKKISISIISMQQLRFIDLFQILWNARSEFIYIRSVFAACHV